ncbi:hypothetical protein RSAG8_05786, partial [Rhizoctonia solani AG-8 WAC10335]
MLEKAIETGRVEATLRADLARVSWESMSIKSKDVSDADFRWWRSAAATLGCCRNQERHEATTLCS